MDRVASGAINLRKKTTTTASILPPSNGRVLLSDLDVLPLLPNPFKDRIQSFPSCESDLLSGSSSVRRMHVRTGGNGLSSLNQRHERTESVKLSNTKEI